MKNNIHREIRHLKHLVKINRAEKNWHKVDQLKNRINVATKYAKRK